MRYLARFMLAWASVLYLIPAVIAASPVAPTVCAQGELQVIACHPVDPMALEGFRALTARTLEGRFPQASLTILERQLKGLLIEARFPAPLPARCFAGQGLDADVEPYLEARHYFFGATPEFGCAGLAEHIATERVFYAKPRACVEHDSAACLADAIELRLTAGTPQP